MMILHGAAIGTVNAGAENIQKELYKQNHHETKLCHKNGYKR
jgi:6-phospho-beta-glucosidase